MIPISIMSDEINDDPGYALDIIKSWGLDYVDFNSVWGRNVCQLDKGQVRKLTMLLHDSGLRTLVINASAFRCFATASEINLHSTYFLKSVELAHKWGVKFVRVFSFWRQVDVLTRQIELNKYFRCVDWMLKVAEDNDITVCIENVSSGNISTSIELQNMFAAFDSTRLKLIWDIANAYAGGEIDAFPAGYERIKGRIVHVHIKDCDFINGKKRWVLLGTGCVKYMDQIKTLEDDCYKGIITLEPHLKKRIFSKEKAAKLSLERLKAVFSV